MLGEALKVEHREVHIFCPWSSQEIGIDEDIAELMTELWRLGMKTSTCCQDSSRGKKPGHKTVWIDFDWVSFCVFARIMTEVAGVEWHITPRHNPINESLIVVGVSFPSQFYDEVLAYFKKEDTVMVSQQRRHVATGHKEINITCPWTREEIGIDEEMVGLVTELWRLDIRTNTCCQGSSSDKTPGHRQVWIDFEWKYFRLFARVIAEVENIQWHIMPRPNPLNRDLTVIVVSFDSTFYDAILAYFKKEEANHEGL